MESLNVKNINDEKIFNVIDPNGQGEVVNRIRPISVSINQKAETINDQTDSTINLAVYWNDTWKSILDLTFDESLRQEYGKLTQDLTNIQKDIDMKQYKDAETKTADFLKYVANLSSKYTAIPEKAVVSKIKNDFVKVIADKNSVKATISDKLLNFMLKKYAKVDTLDYTKANECFSTSKFNFLANNYDFYYHSPEIFQKQAYMTVVKDNKVVGSYKVNYDQFSKFASKFMLTPQKLGYSKDRLAGYMKTAEVVMQNIFFDSVDEAKEWQEMVDEKKKEQATTPEGEEETTETTTTETKTEMGEGKSESPIKEDGGLARPSEDFASDEIPESEPRQQEQQGGGQNLGASRRVNLLKKKAGVRQTQKINNTINDIKQYYNELNQKSKEELMKIVMETYYKDLYNDVGEKDKKILEKKFLENENEEIWKQRLIKDKYTYDKGYDFAFENWGPDEQNINEEILALLNRKMIPEEFYKGVLQGLMAAKMNDIALQKERNRKRRQKYHETKEEWKDIGKMYGESSKEKNLTKKATVGYNAEPENMEEEVAINLADELMSAANVALEKAGLLLGGYSGEEQRRQRVDVQKNAIEPLLKGRFKENIQGKVIDLIKEHLTDLNYHTLVSAIEEIMDSKQASKKVKLNKKALYGDVQEQDIVPAKTETKVYLQSEKVEDFVWLINGSGTIEILAPKALVMGATGSGDNSEGVNKLRDYIKKDLEKISVEEMQKTVSEYGIDNVKEMDKDELERYLVWLLAGDTADNLENRLADEEDLENIKAKNNPNVQKQAEDKGNKKQLPNFSVTVRRNSDDEVVDIIECNNQKEAEETYKYMLSDLDKDCYVSINKLVGKEEYEEIKNSSLNKEESCKKAKTTKKIKKSAGNYDEFAKKLKQEYDNNEQFRSIVNEIRIAGDLMWLPADTSEEEKEQISKEILDFSDGITGTWLSDKSFQMTLEGYLGKEFTPVISEDANETYVNIYNKYKSALDNIDETINSFNKIIDGIAGNEEEKNQIKAQAKEFVKACKEFKTLNEKGQGKDIDSSKNTQVKKQAEETIEEKIEEAETSDMVKGKIGVGDIVTVCIDKLEYPEEAFKYTELIGEPLILMENDKEDINKVIVEQTEYPFQRMTVNKDDICQYAELQGADIVVEDVDGDEMITTFEELPVVAKQCKIKSIHKAANINKKKANLTKKAINSLEDVAGLIDDILSDYDWYDYADQLEVGEKSHYENILADLQKDEKGTIEALFNRVSEDDEEYSSPKIEQLKEYYNNKFSNGGK